MHLWNDVCLIYACIMYCIHLCIDIIHESIYKYNVYGYVCTVLQSATVL
jgi:hypothetical protein